MPVFGEASSVSIEDVKDGLSHTYALGERALTTTGNAGAIWMRSTNKLGNDGSAVAGVCARSAPLNDFTQTDAFSRMHAGGMHFLMADGNVLWFTQDIDPELYEKHAGIDDGY